MAAGPGRLHPSPSVGGNARTVQKGPRPPVGPSSDAGSRSAARARRTLKGGGRGGVRGGPRRSPSGRRLLACAAGSSLSISRCGDAVAAADDHTITLAALNRRRPVRYSASLDRVGVPVFALLAHSLGSRPALGGVLSAVDREHAGSELPVLLGRSERQGCILAYMILCIARRSAPWCRWLRRAVSTGATFGRATRPRQPGVGWPLATGREAGWRVWNEAGSFAGHGGV